MKNGNSGSTAVMERKAAAQAPAARSAGEIVFTQAEARLLLGALVALKQGDSSVRLPSTGSGSRARSPKRSTKSSTSTAASPKSSRACARRSARKASSSNAPASGMSAASGATRSIR